MGTGFTGALAAHLLTELGASVTRVAPRGEDPFTSVSSAYRLWRSQQATVECPSRDDLYAQLAAADACILGGDDHPSAPRVVTSEEIAARHDHLVVLDITGTVPGSAYGAMPANDILAQARSGLSNEQFSDRPIVFGLRLPSYGAVLHGLIGLSAALYLREATGQGDIVRTSFVQGAAVWVTPVWIRAERPHHAMNGIIPKDVAWPIYECSDASWVTYAQGTSGAVKRINDVLGLEVAPGTEKARFTHGNRSPSLYFGVTKEIRDRVSGWESTSLRDALVAVDVPTEIVRSPGECWDDPQVRLNGLIAAADTGEESVGSPIHVSKDANP
jgi:crotonobetainyl-CoA:carnitine CoA-transferase CaiB-like acyl-CoA transferase